MIRPVSLIRRVQFSSGHRYWIPSLSADENRALFGKWASPFNHGHNYVLEVTCKGIPSPPHYMVVNIKDIDDFLQREIVSRFDQRSINDQVPEFETRMPTTESLLLHFAEIMKSMMLPVETTHIRLDETSRLFGEWTKEKNMLTLTRVYEFCASHRLHADQLSNEENVELFGKCNNPSGHGHNYILEVTVSGKPNEQTGMIVDISALDRVVNEKIVDRYDHRYLNVDLPEFAGINPTSEAVALQIFSSLQSSLPAKLERIKLYETARSAFQVTAD